MNGKKIGKWVIFIYVFMCNILRFCIMISSLFLFYFFLNFFFFLAYIFYVLFLQSSSEILASLSSFAFLQFSSIFLSYDCYSYFRVSPVYPLCFVLALHLPLICSHAAESSANPFMVEGGLTDGILYRGQALRMLG